MGVACEAVVQLSPSRAVNLLAGIPIGALVFYFIASALRIPELTDARDTILRKLT